MDFGTKSKVTLKLRMEIDRPFKSVQGRGDGAYDVNARNGLTLGRIGTMAPRFLARSYITRLKVSEKRCKSWALEVV